MQKKKGLIKKRILVSNPGKQYTHRLLYALQLNNYSFKFFTSFWYKQDKFPFFLLKIFPSLIRKKIEREFIKRSFDKLDNEKITQFAWFELIREFSDKISGNKFSERMLFYRDRIHDSFVSMKLKSGRYDLIIGYEECSVKLFKKAKENGLVTVLDLAQIHYKEIENISKQFSALAALYSNVSLRNKINKIKESELALSDFIICLSEFAKASLIKNGIKAERVFVVNLGFDTEKFRPKERYLSSKKLKVVYAGTMTIRKGIDLLMDVNNELNGIMDLTLVGPMADAEKLLNDNYGKFKWIDHVDHDALNDLLQEADLFVFPSYLDSWAMVVIEAMACGLPVIVSENTGSADAVRKGGGFIIPTGDKEELKKKIAYFYNNRDQLEEVGRQARQVALTYTWENYYKQIENVIGDL